MIAKDKLTIKPNETKVRPVTVPLNIITSPYAIRMIVKFLKMLLIRPTPVFFQPAQLTCKPGY